MSECIPCQQQHGYKSNRELIDKAKADAMVYGRKKGYQIMVITRRPNGSYGFRAAGEDLGRCTEVERVYVDPEATA